MPRIAPRSRLRATTSCVRIGRPVRSAGRNLPTTCGWTRSLVAVGGGLPPWTDGIVNTGCIATRGSGNRARRFGRATST
jgi:hypothetical protein